MNVFPFPFFWAEDDGICPLDSLFVGDPHLSPRIWQDLPMTGDARFGLQQAVDIALERRVRRCFLLGDVTDKPRNDSGPISELTEAVNHGSRAGRLALYR